MYIGENRKLKQVGLCVFMEKEACQLTAKNFGTSQAFRAVDINLPNAVTL